MDLNKVLLSGLKSFCYVLAASLLTVLIGSLTLALGYVPTGLLDQTVFTYVVIPLLTGIIAALNNWLQHKND